MFGEHARDSCLIGLGGRRAEGERDLAKAKDTRDQAAKVKKAQQQRLARAQARLDACQAAQPTS